LQRSIYCYAWDLAEDGVEAAVRRFGECGLNTAALAASYHAGKFLRPHGRDGKVYFPEDGTIYFRTAGSRFGEIKPVANSLLQERDVLQELCDNGALKVNAWLVLLHNSRLGQAYPHATVSNAFGDRYIYSLCPSSPPVREYAVALCASIAEEYPIAGLRLETPGFLPFAHGYHHEFGLVRPNEWLHRLLGLCFCQHCIEGARDAGIDADGLRGRVASSIETYLASDVDYPDDMAEAFWLADVVLDIDLVAFLRWRCDVVTSLVEAIRAAVLAKVDVAIIPSVARPSGGAWYEGSDLAALAGAADGVEVCFYEHGADRVAADLLDVQRRIGNDGRIGAILRPGYPDLTERAMVAAAVATLAGGGIHDIGFYNYGHLRASALDWIAGAFSSTEKRP